MRHLSSLSQLVKKAAASLGNARTAAEVLEAKDLAAVVYDVAKRAARLQRAKAAHDDLIVATHRAQADVLEIEALAKRRLADELDALAERGEVATRQNNPGSVGHVSDSDMPPATAADLAFRATTSMTLNSSATLRRLIPASCAGHSMSVWHITGKNSRVQR